jgi:hypothetical protein
MYSQKCKIILMSFDAQFYLAKTLLNIFLFIHKFWELKTQLKIIFVFGFWVNLRHIFHTPKSMKIEFIVVYLCIVF